MMNSASLLPHSTKRIPFISTTAGRKCGPPLCVYWISYCFASLLFFS